MVALLAALVFTAPACKATPPDSLGPFYIPNAPVRASVGRGHVLSGVVRSSRTCRPIARARIEFWLAGPAGDYGPAWRATLFSRRDGSYRFTSHAPPQYGSRRPHIHVRVTARGFRTLVTQYYPRRGATRGTFPLVLLPR